MISFESEILFDANLLTACFSYYLIMMRLNDMSFEYIYIAMILKMFVNDNNENVKRRISLN